MNNTKTNNKGFTLIELLIVIGIIAILAAAVIITITPGERLRDARESTRASHFTAMGTAFHMTVVEVAAYNSIESILVDPDCNGDDEDSSTVVAIGTYRDFTDDCAALVRLGSTAPVDPQSSAQYQVSGTGTGTTSRLVIRTTATESKWRTGGTPGPITY